MSERPVRECPLCVPRPGVGLWCVSAFPSCRGPVPRLRVPTAEQQGVSENALDQMVAGEDPDLAGDELLAFTIASQLVNQHQLMDETYSLGVSAFGEVGMIELTATIGYYCLISLTLNTFRIPLADGMHDPFPGDST